jgi:hypothetical protein
VDQHGGGDDRGRYAREGAPAPRYSGEQHGRGGPVYSNGDSLSANRSHSSTPPARGLAVDEPGGNRWVSGAAGARQRPVRMNVPPPRRRPGKSHAQPT